MEVSRIGEDPHLVIVAIFEPEQGHEAIELRLDHGAFRTPCGQGVTRTGDAQHSVVVGINFSPGAESSGWGSELD